MAWFRKLFPKNYYAYNVGQLMSVKTSAHNMVGFNAYDNTTGKAKVVGGQQYQITGTYTALSLGGVTITPDADGYFTPTQSGELTVTGGNATDTCVHLVWDGERDGEYEPYELHSYLLDSDLELRGIPKLDANNKLYYDGDTYEADGTVTRRYAEITIDPSTLTNNGSNGDFYKVAARPTGKAYGLNNFASDRFVIISGGGAYSMVGRTYSDVVELVLSNSIIGVAADADDNTVKLPAAKTWFTNNPTKLVYELETPTTESADPYQNPQIVNDFGTEEYVVTEQSGVAVPVGHNTKYANNLRAKLEMAPDSPPGDGEYVVKQTDGQNEYIQLAGSDTITAITAKLPSAPSTDGTYVLTCTVTSGVATYTWEAQA